MRLTLAKEPGPSEGCNSMRKAAGWHERQRYRATAARPTMTLGGETPQVAMALSGPSGDGIKWWGSQVATNGGGRHERRRRWLLIELGGSESTTSSSMWPTPSLLLRRSSPSLLLCRLDPARRRICPRLPRVLHSPALSATWSGRRAPSLPH